MAEPDASAAVERDLRLALAAGLEHNFACWLRFVGWQPGSWFELQALGVPGRYGDRVCFAHADSLQAAQDRVAAEGAKAHEDFDAVITAYESAGGEYSEVATDAIARHPLGHELAYVMAKHPAVAKAINGAPNNGAAIYELGRVMARIEMEAEGAKGAPAAEKKPRLSKAPAPVGKPEGGEQVSGTPNLDKLENLTEYRRIRDKIAA